jgi:hypothetical protein
MLADVRAALLLFAFGLLLRLLFWQATADRAAVHAVCYQGDAPIWQRLAGPPEQPPSFERTLPFRPPGTAFHVGLLWNGDPARAWYMRLWFVVLGALVAPLLWLALRRSFSERIALLAAGLCAASTGLLQLGSGVHGEIPYLLLFLLSMLDWPRVRRGSRQAAVRWSLLHAAATLCRAEHVLVYLGLLLLLFLPRAPRAVRTVAWSLATYIAALLPWHLHAFAQVDRFNTDAPPLPQTAMPWTPEATAALRALPAFLQIPSFMFLSDTVRQRGRFRVEAADLGILIEAYGPMSGPLPHPFVALYGPLNFFLANNELADGGFSPAALGLPPPLLGGPGRYPPGLLQVLPLGGQLSLDYPPHVRFVTEGYRIGSGWIAAHPAKALELDARKLQYFWQGAALGFGGYSLPLGLSGERRRVDLTTPEGALATSWRLLLLLLAVLGAFLLRREPAARPWLCFLLVYLAITLAFFGYARLGALCMPAVALLLAAAIDRWLQSRRPSWPWSRIGLGLCATLLAVEFVRWMFAPAVAIDGRPFGAEGLPGETYAVCRISYG